MTYPEPPAIGTEVDTLLGSLERQRATFEWKCEGLTADQLRQRLEPSTLTLGRLLKHLAFMEDLNFTVELAREPLPAPWSERSADTRSEWAFASADDDAPEELYRLWREAVGRSRRAVRSALLDGDAGAEYVSANGHRLTVRRLLVDMVEEYGRHTGQADLIRETLDGRVGEDPPGPPYDFGLDRSDPAWPDLT